VNLIFFTLGVRGDGEMEISHTLLFGLKVAQEFMK